MLFKLIVFLILSDGVINVSAESDNVEWSAFLDEQRDITIHIDPAIKEIVHRVNAINEEFQNYVKAFRSAHGEFPFNLFISSVEYSISDANSTITEDYVHLKDKCALFEADLKLIFKEKQIIMDQYIQVQLKCWTFGKHHQCTAFYTGSPSLWLVLLGIFLFCSLIVSIYFGFCGILNCPEKITRRLNRFRREHPPPVLIDNDSLSSIESGYESPVDI